MEHHPFGGREAPSKSPPEGGDFLEIFYDFLSGCYCNDAMNLKNKKSPLLGGDLEGASYLCTDPG